MLPVRQGGDFMLRPDVIKNHWKSEVDHPSADFF